MNFRCPSCKVKRFVFLLGGSDRTMSSLSLNAPGGVAAPHVSVRTFFAPPAFTPVSLLCPLEPPRRKQTATPSPPPLSHSRRRWGMEWWSERRVEFGMICRDRYWRCLVFSLRVVSPTPWCLLCCFRPTSYATLVSLCCTLATTPLPAQFVNLSSNSPVSLLFISSRHGDRHGRSGCRHLLVLAGSVY